MQRLLVGVSLLAVALSPGTGPEPPAWPIAAGHDVEPQAMIGPAGARFVFPAEAADHVAFPSTIRHAYPGMPVRAWEVDWERAMSPERFGVDPDAIAIVARWRPDSTRMWPFAELIATLRPEVLTFCRSCGTPAALSRDEPAVSVSMDGRQVVVSVRGADAVRRIFPSVPDSVTLTRRVRDEDEQSVTVRVERRNPDR